MSDESPQGWQLDRRIPIALLTTLLLQLGAALIWATRLDARVEGLEQHTINDVVLAEKFARVEERLDVLNRDLLHISVQVERLFEKKERR